LMGFRVVRVDRQHFFVLDYRISDTAATTEDVG